MMHEAWKASMRAKVEHVAKAYDKCRADRQCIYCNEKSAVGILSAPGDPDTPVYEKMTAFYGPESDQVDGYRTIFSLVCTNCGGIHKIDGWSVGVIVLEKEQGNGE